MSSFQNFWAKHSVKYGFSIFKADLSFTWTKIFEETGVEKFFECEESEKIDEIDDPSE